MNAPEWVDRFELVYMPLLVSVHDVPEVDILLVTGGVRTDEDRYRLVRAGKCADKIVAVGTCAISGGVANLGDRDEVRELFLSETRHQVPRLLAKCHPIDTYVDVDLYLPGCPPTSELFMAALEVDEDFQGSKIVCQECGRTKLRDMKPDHLLGFQQGQVLPDICLVNQGYLCVGTSTRGGCRAPCPRAGHPCVGCRGPSDVFIERESQFWFDSIKRVFASMTNIPEAEIDEALRTPQLALFLFQFSDYSGWDRKPRPKEKVL